MATLTDRIDHFVRWFFNVSPMSMAIEPQAPQRRQRSVSRTARPASPKDWRVPRSARQPKVLRFDRRESA
jgi:hypothetical protein